MTIYKKRERKKKKAAQLKINQWIQGIAEKRPRILEGDAVTLSGADPHNAIQSVEGLYNGNLFLYETDKKTYLSARDRLAYHGSPSNVRLSKTDIHKETHSNCTCFYYDFCCTIKSINFNSIFKEIDAQLPKGQEFTIVFTLGLRGVSKKRTQDEIATFCDTLEYDYPDYQIKESEPIVYHGGPNGYGYPMYTCALAFINKLGDDMPKKSIRERHPNLFQKEERKSKDEKMKKREPRVTKRTSTRKQPKVAVESADVTKEMIHTLLKNKKRHYTNADIAEAMGISVRKVAAMAAWHTGKLAQKRK